jgi:integrase/recombinase XerC
MRFVDYINRFDFYLVEERGHSETTANNYCNDIKQLVKKYNDLNDEFKLYSEEHITKFLTDLDVKPRTRNRKMYSIKKFYKFLNKKNKIKHSPATELEGVKEASGKKPIFMTKKEIKSFLKVVDSDDSNSAMRDRAIIYTMIYTGLRASEICNLKISDIDFENSLLEVVKGKGNKNRTIPLHNEAKRYILDYIDTDRESGRVRDKDALFLSNRGRGVGYRTVQRLVKSYLEQSSVDKKITPHKLRHTFGYIFYTKTKDIKMLQEILGHASINTTQIYTHLDNEEKSKQINSLEL